LHKNPKRRVDIKTLLIDPWLHVWSDSKLSSLRKNSDENQNDFKLYTQTKISNLDINL